MALKSKLKAPRGFFKSEDTYYEAFYNINKRALIEAGFPNKGSAVETVKQIVKIDQVKPSEAIKGLGRSELFISAGDRLKSNMLEALKTHDYGVNKSGIKQSAYQQLREMTKSGGRYTKLDPMLFKYLGDNQYSYAGKILISFQNSPEALTLGYIK